MEDHSPNEQGGYQPGFMTKDDSLFGSMLIIKPGAFVPDGWLENYELCRKYRERFGVSVSLPFWFLNSMSVAIELLDEALKRGRRRWVLECGPWATNPPISDFEKIIIEAGHSLQTISLRQASCIWLEPQEWINELKNA
jgi:hypothetical protein